MSSYRREYRRFYESSPHGLVFVIALALAEIAAVLPVPILIRRLFDEAVTQARINAVVETVLLLAALRLVATGASLYNRRLSLGITKSAVRRLRHALYEKLFSLSYRDVKNREVSALHTMVVDETERVDIMSSALISLFLPAVFASLGLGVVLVVVSPGLAAIVAAVTPLVFAAHRVIGKSVIARTDRFRRAFEEFSRGALFIIRSMELTRAAGAGRAEIAKQDASLLEVSRSSAAMAFAHAGYASIQTLIVSISMLMVLGVGASEVARGSMTIGTLAGFYVAGALFAGFTNTMWSTLPLIIAGDRSLRALMELLSVDDSPPYTGVDQLHFRGRIRLENLCFAYDGAEVLRDIDLDVMPGTVVALCGANGAGKTTLVRLILGWERPDRGSLYADERPYAQLDIDSFIRQMGILPQDPIIFTGTIEENITYGRAQISDETLWMAARDAGAADFISELPEGMKTVVGENGRLLSGGQRQRIALARAMLGRPPLLLLDEPGNHLDHDAIGHLLKRLSDWPVPPAVLFVSHTSQMLSEVDRVYHLDGGRLTPETPDGLSVSSTSISPSEYIPHTS
jgi:ABC-type multidrug transport system fused ATPase/permease subunit